jgi:hypothetical protein
MRPKGTTCPQADVQQRLLLCILVIPASEHFRERKQQLPHCQTSTLQRTLISRLRTGATCGSAKSGRLRLSPCQTGDVGSDFKHFGVHKCLFK